MDINQSQVLDTFNGQLDAQKISELKDQVKELTERNDKLKIQQGKSERDTHEFVAYFQRELGRKEDLIASLNEQLASAKLSFETELKDLGDSKDKDLLAFRRTAKNLETELKCKLRAGQDELKQLQSFRDIKIDLENKLNALQNKYDTDIHATREKLAALDRKTLEDKAKAQRDVEHRIERIRHESREEARNGLDADTRKIVTDNKRMGEELRFQLQTTTDLQTEVKRLEKKCSEMSMENSLHAGNEKHFSGHAQAQKAEIRRLCAKIQHMENLLERATSALEHERGVGKLQNLKDMEDQSLDNNGLRHLLKIKNKELRTVKKLAQTILDQRTDVEQFFLESLDVCKKELVADRKRQHAMDQEQIRQKNKALHLGKNPKFPNIRNPKAPRPAQLRAPSNKLDLRDLSWEDRERVLRMLFAKINSTQGMFNAPESSTEEDSLSHVFTTTSLVEN